LEANNVSCEDIDVAEDKSGREQMIAKSGQMGVPVLDIAGEIVFGFDQAQLKQKLGL